MEGNFPVSFKVFTDDFGAIIKRKYGVNLNMGNEDEIKNADEYVSRYFRESFCFIVNASAAILFPQDRWYIQEKNRGDYHIAGRSPERSS